MLIRRVAMFIRVIKTSRIISLLGLGLLGLLRETLDGL